MMSPDLASFAIFCNFVTQVNLNKLMPIGTPFHSRTSALCISHNWRVWSGYLVASSYAVLHDHEYHAIRNSAALIDVSPLYKYDISGNDALKFVNGVIMRD